MANPSTQNEVNRRIDQVREYLYVRHGLLMSRSEMLLSILRAMTLCQTELGTPEAHIEQIDRLFNLEG